MEIKAVITIGVASIAAAVLLFGLAQIFVKLTSDIADPDCNEQSKLNAVCNACMRSLELAKTVARIPTPEGVKLIDNTLPEALSFLCGVLKIDQFSARTCKGYLKHRLPELVYILKHSKRTPAQTCSAFLGTLCGDPGEQLSLGNGVGLQTNKNELQNEQNNRGLSQGDGIFTFDFLGAIMKHKRQNNAELWKINLPPLRGAINGPNKRLVRQRRPKQTRHLRVAHLSDIHFDLLYAEGSPYNCKEFICCRKDSPGKGGVKKKPAGTWGEIRGPCDVPYKTVEHLLNHLSTQRIDYVMWTGDLMPHDEFRRTKLELRSCIHNLTRLFKTTLPRTPVYYAIGNHDTFPLNSFPGPSVRDKTFSTRWIYAELSKGFDQRDQESIKQFNNAGYYSAEIMPGLRLISLNGQFCYNFNFWLLRDDVDPAAQLIWLTKQLQDAESRGQKVHIISHISPGSTSCLLSWSWNYNNIVARFKHVIVGQFFGHNHKDSFQLFYDGEDPYGEAVGVGYIGPSVTTWTYLNPGYRIYDIDSNSFEVKDHHTYFLNLTEANQPNTLPKWQHLYSAIATYGLKSLKPTQWENLVHRMKNNSSLLSQFNTFRTRRTRRNSKCTSSVCQRKSLCGQISGRNLDPLVCENLGLPTINSHAFVNSLLPGKCVKR